MKDYMKKFICIMLAAAIGLFLMGCGSKEAPAEEPVQEDSEITMDDIEEMEGAEEENYDNGISFEEEADGAEITTQKADVKDFMGSWEATSGQAKYQYGNVDFTIKEDGTWTGNITDEDFEGKEQVLRIIDQTTDPGRRQWLIRRLQGGKPYQYIKEHLLPDTRNAGYIRVYWDYLSE